MSTVRFFFLPDRAKNLPGSSTSALPAVAVNAQKDRELRDLLHKRLRIAFSLAVFALGSYALTFFGVTPTLRWFAVLGLVLLALLPSYFLWTRKESTLSALRWFELILLGEFFAFLVIVCMIRIAELESVP